LVREIGSYWDDRLDLVLGVIEIQVEIQAKHRVPKPLGSTPGIDTWHGLPASTVECMYTWIGTWLDRPTLGG